MDNPLSYYTKPEVIQAMLRLHLAVSDEPANDFIPRESLEFFPKIKSLITTHVPAHSGHFLELGCGMGRLCFEVADHFETIEGSDISPDFIHLAKRLQSGEQKAVAKEYQLQNIGVSIEPPRKGLSLFVESAEQSMERHREEGNRFDCIALINLICRIPAPQPLLREAIERLRPGGILVIASPYTVAGEWNSTGFQTEMLDALRGLEWLESTTLPFHYHDFKRRVQISLPEVNVWRASS